MVAINRWLGLAVSVILMAMVGCGDRRLAEAGGDVEWSPDDSRRLVGMDAAEVRSAVEQRVKVSAPAGITEHAWEDVQKLYDRFNGAPLWLDRNGLHEQRTRALLRAAVDASTDAIMLDSLPLESLVAALTALKGDSRTPASAAEADVVLSATYVTLAEFLMRGQVDPRELSQSWHVNPRRQRIDSAIVQSLQAARLDESIARMRPVDPGYDDLRQALVDFRGIVANGGWPAVPEGRPLKRGDRAPAERLDALRRRLEMQGIQVAGPEGGSAAGVFHQGFAGAIAEFQERHGIVVDSILGEETLESLNRPAAFRLAQIAANLERYRWLPRDLGSRYIFVNVPAFRLEAWEGGRKALEMRTVVGAEYDGRSTPVFADSMDHVVFRPYWFVPPNIQQNELEPKVAADPGYMARNNYEYWTDGGVQRIRQRPGDANSLGLVKFMFPNSFNIYLHDTPQRELFKQDVRAFSHGCIRVEKPDELAQWVLGWDATRVERAMNGSRNDQRVNLEEKLPVYIVYFTAYARDGKVYFGNDLYSRDDALVQAVGSASFPSADAMRKLEEIRKLAD